MALVPRDPDYRDPDEHVCHECWHEVVHGSPAPHESNAERSVSGPSGSVATEPAAAPGPQPEREPPRIEDELAAHLHRKHVAARKRP
jgi:hypothetical protein